MRHQIQQKRSAVGGVNAHMKPRYKPRIRLRFPVTFTSGLVSERDRYWT